MYLDTSQLRSDEHEADQDVAPSMQQTMVPQDTGGGAVPYCTNVAMGRCLAN